MLCIKDKVSDQPSCSKNSQPRLKFLKSHKSQLDLCPGNIERLLAAMIFYCQSVMYEKVDHSMDRVLIMYDNGHIRIMNISVTPTVRCGAGIGLDGWKLIKRNIPSKAASQASQLFTVTCTLHNYAQYKEKTIQTYNTGWLCKRFLQKLLCTYYATIKKTCNRLDINQMKSWSCEYAMHTCIVWIAKLHCRAMLHISEGGDWIKLLKSGQFGGKQGVKELGVQVVDCLLNIFSTARISSLWL